MASISRRALATGAISAFAASTALAQTTDKQPKTFVLIHGAWHGGWCWKLVRDRLATEGHRVFTPTLTGLGERAHLMSRQITLDTHIQDIANVFHYEDLSGVCLVGHSYGGWPMTGAVEKVLDRVASIVYLDAFMPENGQKVLDYQPPKGIAAQNEAWAKGEVSREPPKAAFFKVKPALQAWVDSKMSPQPLGVQFTALTTTGARDKVRKKAYIRASSFPQPHFDAGLAKAKALSWRTFELDAGHDIMVDADEELTRILIDVA